MGSQKLSMTDVVCYADEQTEIGIPAEGPFRAGTKLTEFNLEINKDGIDGIPGLGSGVDAGPGLGLGYDVKFSAKYVMGLKEFLTSFLFGFFCDLTTTGTTLYTHTWTPIARNFLVPYRSLNVVYGQGVTLGEGLVVRGIRDCRLTGLTINITNSGFVEGECSGVGLNWGSTAGTETYASYTDEQLPSPVSNANTITYPTQWGLSNPVCLEAINLKWEPQFVVVLPCIGSGEKGDLLYTSWRWTVDTTIQYSEEAIKIENYLNAGTQTMTPYGSLTPHRYFGQLSVNICSIANIGVSSPLNVPYQFGFVMPLQWEPAKVNSSSTPVKLSTSAKTYGPTWSLYVKNDITNAVMRLAA